MVRWERLDFPVKGEDAAMCEERDGVVCAALADGVGSYSGGGVAAHAVVDLVREKFLANESFDLSQVFDDAKLHLEAMSGDLRLGTTLTVMTLARGRIKFAHVGDCRIYLLRGNGIKTITRDQTELAYLVDRGVLNRFEAKNYRRAHVLMSVVAPEKQFDLQTGEVDVLQGDRLILCSDGFYRAISKAMIRSFSFETNFPEFCAGIDSYIKNIEREDDASAFLIEVSPR